MLKFQRNAKILTSTSRARLLIRRPEQLKRPGKCADAGRKEDVCPNRSSQSRTGRSRKTRTPAPAKNATARTAWTTKRCRGRDPKRPDSIASAKPNEDKTGRTAPVSDGAGEC